MGTTTVKLEKAEEEALEKMVKVGLFSSKDEAARTAIVKYASDIGIINPEMIWKKISEHERRKVEPEQLKKDLEKLENES